MRLVLASTSSARRALLARLRLPFEAVAPSFDEAQTRALPPRDQALANARGKAESVRRVHPEAWVIGSDQVGVCEGRPLYKPASEDDALRQLKAMRGKAVVFHTAVCLLRPDAPAQSAVVDTRLRLRADLTDAELSAYLRHEPALDAAGAFHVEGLGIALMAEVESRDPTALVGLPLITLAGWLRPLRALADG